MTESKLWNDERTVKDLGVAVPAWINQDIDCNDVAAICQGGCASGAYMPAVTYWQAKETMNEHGDDILQFIQDSYGELPKPCDDESWAGMAVHDLSCAVELWASSVESELEELLEAAEDDNDEPPEPDGEAFRGREAAGHMAEEQARAKELK